MSHNPIICALDTTDLNKAKQLAYDLHEVVGAVKLGLEFFTSNGPLGIKEVAEKGAPVFLDLKFHDIPNTVAKATCAAVQLGVFMLTLHASGGSDMLKAAVEAANETAEKYLKQKPLLLGVTALTSMDESDLQQVGIANSGNLVSDYVMRLARLSKESGLDGIVCSPHEIKLIKAEFGNSLKIITPGIRPESSSIDDQKRVVTPQKALQLGTDYMVIGRPITQSDNPVKAAGNILRTIA